MMNSLKQIMFAGCVLLVVTGCAVTEPTDQDTLRVRSAIADDPTTSIEQIALELGVSERAVVRAMTAQHARRWQGTPVQAWDAVQDWPLAWIKTSNTAYLCDPKLVYIDADKATPAMQGNLFIDLAWPEIDEAWLIRKPLPYGAMDALYWFDGSGDPVLRVILYGPGLGKEDKQSLRLFEQMWAQSKNASE